MILPRCTATPPSLATARSAPTSRRPAGGPSSSFLLSPGATQQPPLWCCCSPHVNTPAACARACAMRAGCSGDGNGGGMGAAGRRQERGWRWRRRRHDDAYQGRASDAKGADGACLLPCRRAARDARRAARTQHRNAAGRGPRDPGGPLVLCRHPISRGRRRGVRSARARRPVQPSAREEESLELRKAAGRRRDQNPSFH